MRSSSAAAARWEDAADARFFDDVSGEEEVKAFLDSEWRHSRKAKAGGDVGSVGGDHRRSGLVVNLRLLDRAMDEVGVGRYQRIVLVLACFGVFVDVSQTSLVSLLFIEFRREWKATPEDLAVIEAFATSGVLLGNVAFGFLGDRLGRMRLFAATLVACAAAGLASSFTNSVLTFSLCRLVLGCAAGGNGVLCNALLLECVPSRDRGRFTVMTGISFGLAHLVMVGLAWVFFPTLGWRWVLRMAAVLVVPVLLLLRFVSESPRFLVSVRQFGPAEHVVRKIAATNGRPIPSYFNVDNLVWNEDHFGAARPTKGPSVLGALCFGRRNRRVLLPLCAVWFTHYFASGVFSFLPFELKRAIGGKQVPYITACVMSAAGLAATLVNLVMVTRFRRITIIRSTSLAIVVAALSLMTGRHPAALYTSVLAMALTSCMMLATLYLYTPEIFATQVRGSAFGVCLLFGRLGKVLSGFLVAAVIAHDSFYLSALIFAGLFFVCFLATCLLSVESFDQALFEEHHPRSSTRLVSPQLLESARSPESAEDQRRPSEMAGQHMEQQHMAMQQPFDHQLERSSAAIQQAASHPLKTMSKEEELWHLLTEQEKRADALHGALVVAQRNLEQERSEHLQTQERLRAMERACRRLDVMRKVEAELQNQGNPSMAPGLESGAHGNATHVLSQKPRDIRVHGGSGTLNKFAFGSDQLQELIAEHDHKANLSHGRRSSIDRGMRESEREEQEHEEARRAEWRRMSHVKQRVALDDSKKYDIFGNVVQDQQTVQQQQQQQQASNQEETDDIFSGMGGQRSGRQRTGRSDLNADAYLVASSMWRGARPLQQAQGDFH
ncbi:Synaptic vesicle 2-related protein (SV2-related protein) [Durusdinium trenchii]|uniref:Synaptic vesicle 2-related protein (SV2-related protein) n=1 Tax=Durusdinium trenchii TaxID=1381693 RepID=A0ABP0RJH2_9DINO